MVRALLEAGADVTHMHARYGDAIQSALEGLSAAQLALEFTTDSHRPYLEELAGLDFDNFMTFDYRQCPSTRGPQVARKLTRKCHKTVELLLSYGARADSPPGRFGTALALAAFAGLPAKIAQQLLRDGNVDTVELMLNHDNSISLSSDKIVSMINGYDFDCDAPDQRKFAKTLENHPGQYTMTQEVKAAVDSRLRLHSEKPLKDMYYDLAGWTSTEVQ